MKWMEEPEADFDLVWTSEEDVQYCVVVAVYGDPEYPFTQVEKKTMMRVIGEAVEKELLPGQTAAIQSGSPTK